MSRIALAVTLVLMAGPAQGQETCPARPLFAAADPDLTSRCTWKRFYQDVLQDQADVLRFPRTAARHWIPFVALTTATAGLVALDPVDTPYFRRTQRFTEFNEIVSGLNTAAAMAAVPAVFYVARAKAHDSYGKETVLLAAEAIADVQLMTLAAKMIDRRLRPVDVRQGRNYADTWFKAGVLGGKSFPSGHTITAFALADVFVERYPNHRWVPWVAYGLATMVGFSRVTLQSHFPSDVFAGAALGITMTHGLVLQPR